MTTQREQTDERPSWRGPRTGKRYPTAKFHWFKNEVVLCPACDSRPCDPACPEQLQPDTRGQRWKPEGELPAAPPPEQPAAPSQLPPPAGRVVGTGNPRQLVSEAFREAARRKAQAAVEAEEVSR